MSNDKELADLETDLIIFGQCFWVETINEDGELKIERIAPEDIIVSKEHIKEEQMSDTYDPDPDHYPFGTPGLCDRCADDESGESTGVYNSNPPGQPENWTVCPCGTEPELETDDE